MTKEKGPAMGLYFNYADNLRKTTFKNHMQY
jgi:hypothetical protein